MCDVAIPAWLQTDADDENLYIPSQDYSSDSDAEDASSSPPSQHSPSVSPVPPQEPLQQETIQPSEEARDAESPNVVTPVKKAKKRGAKKKGSKKAPPPRPKGKKVFKDSDLALMEKLIKENEKAPPIPRKVAQATVPAKPENEEHLRELRNKLRAKINGRGETNRTIIMEAPVKKSSVPPAPEMPPVPGAGYFRAKGVAPPTPSSRERTLGVLRQYEPYIQRGEISSDKAIEYAMRGVEPEQTGYLKPPFQHEQEIMTDEKLTPEALDLVNRYDSLCSKEGEVLNRLSPNDPSSLERLLTVRNELRQSQKAILPNLVDFFLRSTTYVTSMTAISKHEKTNGESPYVASCWKGMYTRMYKRFSDKAPPGLKANAHQCLEEVFYEYVLKQYVSDAVCSYISDMEDQGVFESFPDPFVIFGMQKNELDLFPRPEVVIPLQQMIDLKFVPSNISSFSPYGSKPFAHAVFWSMNPHFNLLLSYYRVQDAEGKIQPRAYKVHWVTYDRMAPMQDYVPSDAPPEDVTPCKAVTELLDEVSGKFTPEKDLGLALAQSAREESSSSSDSEIDTTNVELVFDKTTIVRNRDGIKMAEISFSKNDRGEIAADFHFEANVSPAYSSRIQKAFLKGIKLKNDELA